MKYFLALILSVSAFATQNSTVVWEVHQAGVSTNGAGFDPSAGTCGTDRSQQNAAQFDYTDLIVGATTTQGTSIAHAFTSAEVCNVVKITAGAGCTTGYFTINSVSGSTATFDRSLGTAASVCTAHLGGAADKMTTLTALIAKQHVYVMADANYVITGTMSLNVSAGVIYEGYTTVRGDNGKATIITSTNGFGRLVDLSGNGNTTLKNFTIDCNSTTSNRGLGLLGAFQVAENILFKNCQFGGLLFNNVQSQCIYCRSTGHGPLAAAFSSPSGSYGSICMYCVADSGTSTGFSLIDGECVFCLSINNTGATSDGFDCSTGNCVIISSIAYGNGRDGIRGTDTTSGPAVYYNNILESNAGYGIRFTTTQTYIPCASNAFYNNTTGTRSGVSTCTNDVTPSVEPFVAPGSNNFALNNTAGGGASLRAVGYLGVLPLGGTGYQDIGALQHADPAAAATQSSVAIAQ